MAEDLLGIGKASEELASLISPLLRPGAETAGQIIADQMNSWRLKRGIMLVESMMQLLKSRNREQKSLPYKILASVLNNGSLEEDETLTAKWVGLLASAAAGDGIHPSFPSILTQLTPNEGSHYHWNQNVR